MNARINLFLIVTLVSANALFAQVRGIVTDTNGEPLPFASVYVQGTTTGTTTNINGEYFIELEKGSHTLVFQYIGYRQKVERVTVSAGPVRLNIKLEEETINLMQVEVTANAEDPAYAIMRKAIARRKYHKEQVKSFACDVYIKGNVKVLDAPEKILGQEIGDMEGSLDTNRQGIVYLSESVSKYYFQQPNKYKEVMVSSKVSGNDNGFSFNSARDMQIDLYENFIEFGRNVISPVADGAMGYYRYKLQGVIVDEQGYFINKIEVIPKRNEDPVFHGFIYIVDKLWNIQSTDLYLTGNSIQQPFIDTFYVRQTHVPVKEPDVWRQFSQTFSLTGGAFGFKFGGSFTGIYTSYNLEPDLPANFFGNEVMKVEKGANEKDTAYWNATRPVALTNDEESDYQKKDSLQVLRATKPWLDSLDKKNNKFKFDKLIFGYTNTNSWKGRSISFESPINTIQFNAVQGYNIYLGAGYRKNFDKESLRWLEVKARTSYGFSEEKFRLGGETTYNFNRKNFSRLSVSGGREVAQFNETEPISTLLNTFYSTFFHRNYIRLFDKTWFRVNYRQEIANGVLMQAFAQWAKRSPLENHSDYSFFYKDSRDHAPNFPDNPALEAGELAESRAATVGLSFRFRIAQKYLNYPDRKYIMGSAWPDIWVHYRRGFSFGEASENGFRSNVSYDRLSVALSKNNIALGLTGTTSFRFEAGKFLTDNQLFFQDYKHFSGNETNIGNSSNYLTSFKMLPYYGHSTRSAWMEGHWEHNFKGFLTDKVPGLKKLGWSMVAGAGFLYTKENREYQEVSLGLDNLGFGMFRFLRFDVVSSFDASGYVGTGWLIGLNFPVGEISL